MWALYIWIVKRHPEAKLCTSKTRFANALQSDCEAKYATGVSENNFKTALAEGSEIDSSLTLRMTGKTIPSPLPLSLREREEVVGEE